jgi:phosphomannomutase / phosphoglucomutase
MSPHCDDEKKYGVVERLTARIAALHADGQQLDGRTIVEVNTVNGVRFAFENGSWGLIRASSNKPELVVVCESMQSEAEMREIFDIIRRLLAGEDAVKSFNQEL